MESETPGRMSGNREFDDQQQLQLVQQQQAQMQQWSQGVNNGEMGQNEEMNALRQQQLLHQQIAMSQQHAMAPAMMGLSPMMQQQAQQSAIVMPGMHQGQLATSPVASSGSYLMVQGGNDVYRSDLMGNPTMMPPQPAQTPPNDEQRVWQQQFSNAGHFGGIRYGDKGMEGEKGPIDFYQQQQGYEFRQSAQERAAVAQMALAAQHPAAIAMAAAAAAAAQQMSQQSPQFYAPGMPPPQGPAQSPPPGAAMAGLMPADASTGQALQMPPRPRPEGGLETTSIGCPADGVGVEGGSDGMHFDAGLKKSVNEELVIDSWGGDDNELNANSSQQQQRAMPPPNFGWGAPPPAPLSGSWGPPPSADTMKVGNWHQPPPMQVAPTQGGRGRGQGGDGGRGFGQGRGGGNRYGRGSERPYSSQDHAKEKLDGRTSAIAETMAMMKKMAMEDKERKKESEERRRKRNEELGVDKAGDDVTSSSDADQGQDQEERKDFRRQARYSGGGGRGGNYGGRGGNYGGRGGGRGGFNSRDFNRFMNPSDPTASSLMMMNMGAQTGPGPMLFGPPTNATAAAAVAAAQAQRLFPGLENFFPQGCPPAGANLAAPPFQPGVPIGTGPVPPFMPHFPPETGMRGAAFGGFGGRGRAPPADPSMLMMQSGQSGRGGFQQFRGHFQRSGGGRGFRPGGPGRVGPVDSNKKAEDENGNKGEEAFETEQTVASQESKELEGRNVFDASNSESLVKDGGNYEDLNADKGLTDVKDDSKEQEGEVEPEKSKLSTESSDEPKSVENSAKVTKKKPRRKRATKAFTSTESTPTSTKPTTSVKSTIATTKSNTNTKRVGAAVVELSLRERLIVQLERGSGECMVCLERVRTSHGIWSCRGGCFQIFHIHCIKKWARSNVEGGERWRCPGCQRAHEFSGLYYQCFCLKVREPEYSGHDTPHSCGQVCGLTKECGHKCNDLCHPGPCPPCNVGVRRRCGCGKSERRQRCSDHSNFLCGGKCERTLNCGHHICQQLCHNGECQVCDNLIIQHCHCGKQGRRVSCDISSFGKSFYSCGDVCNKSFSCGRHKCDRICHENECGPCPLSLIETCHCGKKSLESLGETRSDCTDPVPSCGQKCGKGLDCGHECDHTCHQGQCPPCKLNSSVKCKCGWSVQSVPCADLRDGVEVKCNRKCGQKKPCGRHKCNELCCDATDHTCDRRCDKRLSCGNHRCEEACHRGPCLPCPHVSFDELSCHCGLHVLPPPIQCGQRRPPCDAPCQRRHDCDHIVRHNCHDEAQCPPCTEFTERMCYGNHELRKNVYCHIEGVSCGRPCGKELNCGRHKCNKICHDGPCQASNEICRQPCTKIREECGHKCNAPCHDQDCPRTKCLEKVRVSCECGNLKAWRICGDQQSDYRKLQLAAAVRSDDGSIMSISRSTQKLPCNEDCRQLIRNQQLALALQIQNPELVPSRLAAPNFSEMLKNWVRRDVKFVQMVHDKLTELVKLAKDSKQKSRCHSFPVMSREKRAFVHEYCAHFGCSSDSFDAEPNRNVVATAEKIKAFLPSQSVVDAVTKQRRAPGPVML